MDYEVRASGVRPYPLQTHVYNVPDAEEEQIEAHVEAIAQKVFVLGGWLVATEDVQS